MLHEISCFYLLACIWCLRFKYKLTKYVVSSLYVHTYYTWNSSERFCLHNESNLGNRTDYDWINTHDVFVTWNYFICELLYYVYTAEYLDSLTVTIFFLFLLLLCSIWAFTHMTAMTWQAYARIRIMETIINFQRDIILVILEIFVGIC